MIAALSAHPDGPEAIPINAQLATVYLADSDPAKSALALPILLKLHGSNPDNLAVTRVLARLYSRTGDYAQSDQAL